MICIALQECKLHPSIQNRDSDRDRCVPSRGTVEFTDVAEPPKEEGAVAVADTDEEESSPLNRLRLGKKKQKNHLQAAVA